MDADFAGTLGCCLCGTVTHSALLLDCLHSCCQDCAGTDERKSIMCRLCKDVSSLTGRDTNRFVSAQLQAYSSCWGVICCNVCKKKRVEQQADHWCKECGQHLCDDCMQEHQIHVPAHNKHIEALNDALSELVIYIAATQPCSAHGEKCSFYCKKCIAVKCTTCVMACLSSKHDLEHMDSKEANQSVQHLKQQLRELLDLLESKSSLVTSAIKLPDDLQRARQADMDALERNKAVAITALHKAYKAAADELDSMHDAIGVGAIEAAEAAQLLDTKVEQAIKYGKCMLDFGDMVSLLEQQQQVLSRLQSLVDEVSALPAAVQPSTCITIQSSLPDNLDETCKNWIGVPKQQTNKCASECTSLQTTLADKRVTWMGAAVAVGRGLLSLMDTSNMLALKPRRIKTGKLMDSRYCCSKPYVDWADVSYRSSYVKNDPGYCILSVAATADAVITASERQVQLSGSRKPYLVDSYSHSGQLLWRQSISEPVHDLHWSRVLSVLYLVLRDNDRVTVIRAVDGQQVSVVLNSSHRLKELCRMSLSRGPKTVLAVLHDDEKTVTVYPALGSGGSK